jgi:hypothetical protein
MQLQELLNFIYMKKYLLGLIAIIIVVALSAYNKPERANRANYYSFQYKAPGGSYSEANVESISLASWGNAILLPNGSCARSCDQTATLEKACEIVMHESETIVDRGVRRIRVPAEGGSVTIVAATAGIHVNTYFVDGINSVSLTCIQNRKF